MTEHYEGEPDYAVPPGEYIAEWLEDHKITQTEFAQRLGVSRKHINRVIAGAALTADMAQRLEFVTGVAARRWLALEAMYRADVERLAMEESLASRSELLDAVAHLASYLRKQGVVTATRRKPGQLLMQLMAFFAVADADLLQARFDQPAAAFRQATAHEVDWACVAGWLRLGEIEAYEDLRSAARFDPRKLHAALPEIRGVSRLESTRIRPELRRVLGAAGVVLVVIPEVPGSRAYGATRWLEGTPVIQLSLRRRDDGHFWFTLFHELGHVLLHPAADFLEGISADGDSEVAADQFARDTLIPPAEVSKLRGLRSLEAVAEIAEELGVSPGVVVGRLHHDGVWPPSRGQRLFRRFEFTDHATA